MYLAAVVVAALSLVFTLGILLTDRPTDPKPSVELASSVSLVILSLSAAVYNECCKLHCANASRHVMLSL